MKRFSSKLSSIALLVFVSCGIGNNQQNLENLKKDLIGNWISTYNEDSLKLHLIDSSLAQINIKKGIAPWRENKFIYKIDTIHNETFLKLSSIDSVKDVLVIFIRKINKDEFKAQYYDPAFPIGQKKIWLVENKNNTQVFRRL